MNSLRIQNLRSLKDSGFIDIRPLTFLLGQNSSGKSTFLRTFPLIRQSVSYDSKTRSPLAWNGRYVDFGSFNEALRSQAEAEIPNDEIRFSFRFLVARMYALRYYRIHGGDNGENSGCPIEISIGVKQVKGSNASFLSSFYMIIADEHRVEFDLLPVSNNVEGEFRYSVKINGVNFSQLEEKFDIIGGDSVVPYLIYKDIKSGQGGAAQSFYTKSRWTVEEFLGDLLNTLRDLGGSMSNNKMIELVNNIHISSSRNMFEQIFSSDVITKRFSNKLQGIDAQGKDFRKFINHLLLMSLPTLLEAAQETISSTFNNCRYIGPARATAERHYRIQDSIFDEIDSSGTNTAAFLHALMPAQMENFKEWALNNFGFEPIVVSTGSHLMLEVKRNTDFRASNLADTGFGFSQILPIVAQLWSIIYHNMKNRPRSSRIISYAAPVIFCIEQPELHLHPRFQAQLLRAFVAAVKSANESGIDLRFVIETHSETMMNSLGQLVSAKSIENSQINVVVFDNSESSMHTHVKLSKYDEDGFLLDWPIGFFDGDVTQ